jgi:hypothetical protein
MLCTEGYPLLSVFALLRVLCSAQNVNCVLLSVLCLIRILGSAQTFMLCSVRHAFLSVFCFAHGVMLRVLSSAQCVVFCSVCCALLSVLFSAQCVVL